MFSERSQQIPFAYKLQKSLIVEKKAQEGQPILVHIPGL